MSRIWATILGALAVALFGIATIAGSAAGAISRAIVQGDGSPYP